VSAPTAGAGLGDLAVDVQRRLEALYALEPEAPVTDFMIAPGDAAHLPGGGSRTLVAQEGDEVSVGVVLDAEVGARLERRDPRLCLDTQNLGPFSTLTEEVSHFLYLLFRARSQRPVTQLELELQGEIDKYLTAAFFISRQNEGAVPARLRHALFRSYRLADGVEGERAERYHAASRLADRYCGWLESRFLRRPHLRELPREARRFWRLGQRGKLETIAGLN
jgi:hypothetical protein